MPKTGLKKNVKLAYILFFFQKILKVKLKIFFQNSETILLKQFCPNFLFMFSELKVGTTPLFFGKHFKCKNLCTNFLSC